MGDGPDEQRLIFFLKFYPLFKNKLNKNNKIIILNKIDIE